MKMLITMRMVMQSSLLSPLSLNQIIVTMRLLPLHLGWLQPTLLILFEGAPVGETLRNNKSNIVPEGAAQDTQSTTPGDPINFTPEGDVSHSNSSPEGATHDISMPLFLENIATN
jgi:hypothetical protein